MRNSNNIFKIKFKVEYRIFFFNKERDMLEIIDILRFY